MKTKVFLWGRHGKMGKAIEKLAKDIPDIEIAGGFDHRPTNDDYHTYSDPGAIDTDYDIIVDFSHAGAIDGLLVATSKRPRPIVIASTGHDKMQMTAIRKLSKIVPIFLSGNMSLGVNLASRIVRLAACALEGWDIEVVEKHHNQKEDAPSGTALLLADSANKGLANPRAYTYGRSGQAKRTPTEIGIHAVRGGTIIGEHDVIFAGPHETVTITHSALSRSIFASGALKAAQYLVGKNPGIYNMDNLLEGCYGATDNR